MFKTVVFNQFNLHPDPEVGHYIILPVKAGVEWPSRTEIGHHGVDEQNMKSVVRKGKGWSPSETGLVSDQRFNSL